MTTRRSFLIGFGAGLLLTMGDSFAQGGKPPAPAADTPAVAVVRQFLAARAAGKYDAAYVLLSIHSQQSIPKRQFLAGAPSPLEEDRAVPASLFAVANLFGDTHDTLGYVFDIIGPDPVDSSCVLVRARRGTTSAIVLRLLTIIDAGASTLRLDVVGSLDQARPKEPEKTREEAQQATSLSNLRQLALGIIQYTQDKGEMPDADKWVDEVLPFVKEEALFHDPSAPVGEKWSYAYNRTLSHKSLALFDAPASTVMLFESTTGVKNASDTGQSVPHPGRHSGGTDYALADGHVKWFPDGTKLSYRLDGK